MKRYDTGDKVTVISQRDKRIRYAGFIAPMADYYGQTVKVESVTKNYQDTGKYAYRIGGMWFVEDMIVEQPVITLPEELFEI